MYKLKLFKQTCSKMSRQLYLQLCTLQHCIQATAATFKIKLYTQLSQMALQLSCKLLYRPILNVKTMFLKHITDHCLRCAMSNFNRYSAVIWVAYSLCFQRNILVNTQNSDGISKLNFGCVFCFTEEWLIEAQIVAFTAWLQSGGARLPAVPRIRTGIHRETDLNRSKMCSGELYLTKLNPLAIVTAKLFAGVNRTSSAIRSLSILWRISDRRYNE